MSTGVRASYSATGGRSSSDPVAATKQKGTSHGGDGSLSRPEGGNPLSDPEMGLDGGQRGPGWGLIAFPLLAEPNSTTSGSGAQNGGMGGLLTCAYRTPGALPCRRAAL